MSPSLKLSPADCPLASLHYPPGLTFSRSSSAPPSAAPPPPPCPVPYTLTPPPLASQDPHHLVWASLLLSPNRRCLVLRPHGPSPARRGWSGHLGSGIPENPCYKAGTSIMRRGCRPRRRVESQATLWDLCRSSPDPGGNGRTALNSSSQEALPHPLTVWSPRSDPVLCICQELEDASRLIDPRNSPRHQGGGCPSIRGCDPLWTGSPTGAQLTLSRHYWVVI